VFSRLGYIAARRPKLVLILSGLFIVITGAVGTLVIPAMSSAGYDDPKSDSSKAYTYLKNHFGVEDPWSTLVLDAGVSVDDPAVASSVVDITKTILGVPGVDHVTSYWSLGQPAQLRSIDGKAGYLFVYIKATGIDQANLIAKQVETAVDALHSKLHVYYYGSGAIFNGINGRVTSDIAFAETIAIPLSALLTLVVFGSLIAAATPFVVSLFAIPGALFVLWLVQRFTEVSVFGLNILTGLGLGLGIDYALLIVSRFREELGRTDDVEAAVVATIESAGRTVFFSGVTVALTLASLFVFPLYFLRTFAWAGVSVVLLAIVGALLPMPAMLSLLGRRIDFGRLRNVQPVSDHGLWSRLAGFVMHRPWRVVAATLLVLGVFASPALHLQTGQPDERVLPASEPVAIAGQVIRDRFEGRESQPVEILIPGGHNVQSVTDAYAQAISRLPHIVRVITPEGVLVKGVVVAPNPMSAQFSAGADVRLNAISDVDARTPAGESLVTAIRGLTPPAPSTLVGGSAAIYTDAQHGVLDNVPTAMLWIALATLLILFLFTGSVLLPIKAVILNLLSLAATFGVITWIFQDGHLSGLLGGFTLRGVVDTSQLVLIVIVVFGLSMDYELFLLSRIKELHDEGMDTVPAVQLGLQRSGRIITAAAVILAAVFSAFISSGVTSMKLIGFGVAFAILLDASIVRALLVPALMRIAGRWNWWAPAPLRRLHDKLHLTH
jgi:RND superfamily putative drug exporter